MTLCTCTHQGTGTRLLLGSEGTRLPCIQCGNYSREPNRQERHEHEANRKRALKRHRKRLAAVIPFASEILEAEDRGMTVTEYIDSQTA